MQLDLLPVVQPEAVRGETIEQRFRRFHAANPHVYENLRRLALDLRGRGRARWGLKGLYEALRWRYAIETTGDVFRLNNNYTALYARLLMQQEPALAGFFEVRERRSA